MKKLTGAIMKEAHKLTRELKMEFPNVDYKAQLGICISYLLEEGVKEMKELKGSEKQIKWANDIRENLIKSCEEAINELEDNKWNKYYGMLDLALINKLENAESFIEGRGRGGFEAAYPRQEEKALTIYKKYAYRILNDDIFYKWLRIGKVERATALVKLLCEAIETENEEMFEDCIIEGEFKSRKFAIKFKKANLELN